MDIQKQKTMIYHRPTLNYQQLVLLFILGLCALQILTASVIKTEYSALTSQDSILKNKLFYFFTVLESDETIQRSISKSKLLKDISSAQSERAQRSLKSCKTGKCYAKAIQWNDKEINLAGTEIIRILERNKKTGSVVAGLKRSGHYSIHHELGDTAFIRQVWKNSAAGINRILETYLGGTPPKRYAAIDSISFNQSSPIFVAKADSMLQARIQKKGSYRSFFDFPLSVSLDVLKINGRDEAARYEPLTAGHNAAAFAKAKRTDWTTYRYSVLLVPGFGPEEAGVSIHEKGIQRCRMAAERFKQGVAPFIIVSGGHVYPFRTPFSEAVEMKRYLMEKLQIPEDAIIIEPHARHTTTNIRNASRIIYRFGIPDEKPGLVVTDAAQTAMIATLDARCMRELEYVPYRNTKVLNHNEVEFYPSPKVFQINLHDVLDP